MDALDYLRECDDPVVRWIASHNGGYIIEDVCDVIEAHIAYWKSWRGWGRLMLYYIAALFIIMNGLVFLLGWLV